MRTVTPILSQCSVKVSSVLCKWPPQAPCLLCPESWSHSILWPVLVKCSTTAGGTKIHVL